MFACFLSRGPTHEPHDALPLVQISMLVKALQSIGFGHFVAHEIHRLHTSLPVGDVPLVMRLDGHCLLPCLPPCGSPGSELGDAFCQGSSAKGELGHRGSMAAVAVAATAGVDLVGEAGLVRGSSRWRPW